jgi:hypothetical protein
MDLLPQIQPGHVALVSQLCCALQRHGLRPQTVQPDHRYRGSLRVAPYFLFAHG